jgi:hypothetical protein
MSEVITVELPADLARQARAWAAATNRRLEDAIVEWVSRGVAEPAVESLPDDAVLALCDAALPPEQQADLSDLLARQREGALAAAEAARLDGLLSEYRRGLVLKARAWKEAVTRGLRPRLADGS